MNIMSKLPRFFSNTLSKSFAKNIVHLDQNNIYFPFSIRWICIVHHMVKGFQSMAC